MRSMRPKENQGLSITALLLIVVRARRRWEVFSLQYRKSGMLIFA